MAADTIGFEYDPVLSLNRTEVSNAVLYGKFPVTVTRRGERVQRDLSSPARLTYIGLRSLDWQGKNHEHYSWSSLCLLLNLSRRTLAEHLDELESAGLIFRGHLSRSGTRVYSWGIPPLREVWRALMLKRWVCNYEPGEELIRRPNGALPKNRTEFDELYDAWWEIRHERLVREWEDMMETRLRHATGHR